jgi:hypothetical protein
VFRPGSVELWLIGSLSECPSAEELYNYKSQRWLWNEREQLQRRYVRFDLPALIRVIEEAIGDTSCSALTKLPEGNFNKAFLATMQDGRELIARLPNPNAGRSYYTTASEVATMDYVCFFSLSSMGTQITLLML